MSGGRRNRLHVGMVAMVTMLLLLFGKDACSASSLIHQMAHPVLLLVRMCCPHYDQLASTPWLKRSLRLFVRSVTGYLTCENGRNHRRLPHVNLKKMCTPCGCGRSVRSRLRAQAINRRFLVLRS